MAEELIGQGDNSRHVYDRGYPTGPVCVGDLSAKLRGDIRVIDPDLLLNDAPVPDGMEVGFGAWPLSRNEVSAAVIVKGHMQGLMNIAEGF